MLLGNEVLLSNPCAPFICCPFHATTTRVSCDRSKLEFVLQAKRTIQPVYCPSVNCSFTRSAFIYLPLLLLIITTGLHMVICRSSFLEQTGMSCRGLWNVLVGDHWTGEYWWVDWRMSWVERDRQKNGNVPGQRQLAWCENVMGQSWKCARSGPKNVTGLTGKIPGYVSDPIECSGVK